jgi:hypothetical protein
LRPVEIVSIFHDCFDLHSNNLSNDLRVITKSELYDKLAAMYAEDERIQRRLQLEAERLTSLLKINKPELERFDLFATKVWDFRLEQFPIQTARKASSSTLFSTGNIIALGLAVLFVYLILKFGMPSK